ncbi:MAG: hypothetical protein WCG99_02265 [Candidatus Berkelbacteria bacterium]
MCRSKSRKSKQAQPVQQFNLRWIWIVPVLLLGLAVIVLSRPHRQPVVVPASTPVQASPEVQAPWDMSNGLTESQLAKLREKIGAVLIVGTGDPVLEISHLTTWLKSQLDSGKAAMSVVPLATGETVAFTQMTGTPKLPTIIFAGPVLWQRMMELAPDDFSNNILESICHEALHLRLTPATLGESRTDASHRRYVAGEAKVWAYQIPKIVRPMMKAGRMTDIVSQKAETGFAAVGNKNNADWYKWVEANLCVKSQ